LASEQVRLQAPPWQLVGQVWVLPGWQIPLPSHMRAEDSVVPVQLPGAHSVVAAYLWQAPLPSHMPSLRQVAAPSSWQSLSRSSPAGTGTQRPSEPGSLQVVQASVHEVSQQKPSTQDLVWHWEPVVQLAPRALGGGGPASGGTVMPPIPPVSSVPTMPPVFLGGALLPLHAASNANARSAGARSVARMCATIHLEISRYGRTVSQSIGFKGAKLFNKIR
jgi:hypothetical protein